MLRPATWQGSVRQHGQAGLYLRKKWLEFGGAGSRIQGGFHGIEWPPCQASAVKDRWTRSKWVFILPILGDEPSDDIIRYHEIPSPVYTLPLGRSHPLTLTEYGTLAERTGGKMLHLDFK